MKCRYWDCGWCYAPIDVVTSASSCGSCIYPEHCLYLKTEMTEKEQIQNQIQELQEKLKKLEEVENEKMEFKDEGRFHFFHYNGKPYQRLEYTVIPNVSWFESLSTLEYPIPVYEKVMNSELNKKLEELYQKQIVPEEPEENEWKSAALRFGEELVSVGPNGYYGFTAEEWFDWVVNTYEKLCDDTVKLLKKENLKKAQERGERVHKKMEETIKIHDGYGGVDYKPTPQTPEQIADGLKKAFREAVKRGVVSSTKSPTLYDICVEWNDDDDNPPVSDLIDAIEQWLPKEQSAEGSQNAYVESAVEGFNDCLQQIKSKLR
jgi:prefoldin subunit 5